MLRYVSIGGAVFGGVVVLMAPWLFRLVLAEKFDVALHLVPWVTAGSVTLGLAWIMQNVFWCKKQSRWVTVAFLVGLFVSIGSTYVLIPSLGVVGVAIGGTVAANATLCCMLVFARATGLDFLAENLCVIRVAAVDRRNVNGSPQDDRPDSQTPPRVQEVPKSESPKVLKSESPKVLKS